VKPGDILVGKITPKSETELAPEERCCAPSSVKRPRT
jgi:DNA-directed RNA polymerase beta subunit